MRIHPLIAAVSCLGLSLPLAAAPDDVVVQTAGFTLTRGDYERGLLELLGAEEGRKMAAQGPNAFYAQEILRSRVLVEHGKKLGLDRAPEVLALPAEKRLEAIRMGAARAIRAGVKVDEPMLRRHYERRAKAGEFATATLRHVLITHAESAVDEPDRRSRAEARKAAQELLAEIRRGDLKFDEAIAEYSEHAASRKRQGRFTLRRNSTMSMEFEEVVFAGPLKKLTLVESEFGVHLLEVESRGNVPFEKVREDLEATAADVEVDLIVDGLVAATKPRFAKGYAPAEG